MSTSIKQGLFVLSVACALALSCAQPKSREAENGGSSFLAFNSPDIPNVNYTHFRLLIQPTAAYASNPKCSKPAPIFRKKEEGKNLQITVANNCAYYIGADLGSAMRSDPEKMAEVYYTNMLSGSLGDEIPAAKLTGGKIPVEITLYKATGANLPDNAPGGFKTQAEVELNLSFTLNGPTARPNDQNNMYVEETMSDVRFTIPPENERRAWDRDPSNGVDWNTKDTTVYGRVGKTFTLCSSDPKKKVLHTTGGIPFPHGRLIEGNKEEGVRYDSKRSNPYICEVFETKIEWINKGTLNEHYQQNELFYFEVKAN